ERKDTVLLGGSGNGVDACGRFNPDHLDPSARSTVRTRYDIPDDAVVIGYLGRIVRDKGLIELIEAWNALREEFPRLHLLVMGDFEPQDPVPVEVERIMREDPRIHLTGFTHDTSSHYAAMDIMTLPSYREGFPNTPLEGASMGLPVVSTRVPGCIDAVEDGVTGLLVPPQDSGALRDAFRAYLTDPDLRMRHGRAGRDRVMREFRHELIREALYKEYLLLLKSRHIPIHASSADP
ncbi:MAG: glycosyltransferase, partial [Armatimonadetes bacterium]|nr:glycosyltransferase [Armatimonadota bacterium]